jgi:SAM-dependent methyltransferase
VDDPVIRAHYEAGVEEDRLVANGEPGLELVRTLELLDRFLPAPPARILDIGGGPGVYAGILAKQGYEVCLLDLVPLHVQQAQAASAAQPAAPFEARVGDARDLTDPDDSWDAALLLGPLYHLTERDDRLKALREARRVVRPGGPVLAVAVSRFASVLDGLRAGYLLEPAFWEIVERDLREGQHRNPTNHPGWFTTAFFHHPDELAAEVEEAGLEAEALLGIEGPACWFPGTWESEDGRNAALSAARAVEAEPAILAASAHLLAVGRVQLVEPKNAQAGSSQ